MSWKSSTENVLCRPALFEQPLLGERLQHDRRRRQRERHPHGERRLPAQAERERHRADGRRGPDHLQPAEPEDRRAQPPEQRRLELQPDDEQHHHHAELGEVQHVLATRAADEA
jgi:hypothetical protein